MYEDFYRLKRKPFSIAPDPGFLFLSDRHREALAHLMYGLETEGGFVLVTGEVGTGKTTLIRSLIDRIPEGVDVAFILNPRVTAHELLQSLCEELGIGETPGEAHSVKHYVDRLTKHLLERHRRGRNTVMIIDEAQNLSPAVLEQIRLLTNLETNEQKLLRIILLGQPELAELLDRRDMRQLSQRITARYHLGALDPDETQAYLAHRLSLAGGNPNLFTRAASRRIHRLAGGIPRLINVIADRALLGAYVEGKQRVGAAIVARAGREVLGGGRDRSRVWIFATLGVCALVGGAWAYLALPEPRLDAPHAQTEATPPPSVPTPSPPAALAPAPVPVPAATTTSEVPAAASPLAQREAPDSSRASPLPQNAVAEPSWASAPAPAAVEEPTTSTTDSIARPAGLTPFETQRLAYRAVFARWGRPIDESDIPCNSAVDVGLQCFRETGGWDALVRNDRPAVIELWDSRTEPFYAAAVGVADGVIELIVGRDTVRATRATLERQWYGNSVVLWQMPPHYRGSLKLGDDDATVTWLREQLTAIGGEPLAAAAAQRFDQTLHDALVKFQRDAGLVPDGIAGPATWIALGRATGVDEPSLGEET
jgi:general secretion pathway protein A